MIPVSERRKRRKPDYGKKEKLPENEKTKHSRKCKMCGAVYHPVCLCCGYVNRKSAIFSTDKLFIRAGDYKRDVPDSL